MPLLNYQHPAVTIEQKTVNTAVGTIDRSSALIVGPQHVVVPYVAGEDGTTFSDEGLNIDMVGLANGEVPDESFTRVYGEKLEASLLALTGASTARGQIVDGRNNVIRLRPFYDDSDLRLTYSASPTAGVNITVIGELYQNKTGTAVTNVAGIASIPNNGLFSPAAAHTLTSGQIFLHVVSDVNASEFAEIDPDLVVAGTSLDSGFRGRDVKIGDKLVLSVPASLDADVESVSRTVVALEAYPVPSTWSDPIVVSGAYAGSGFAVEYGSSLTGYSGSATTRYLIEVLNGGVYGAAVQRRVRVSDDAGLVTPYIVNITQDNSGAYTNVFDVIPGLTLRFSDDNDNIPAGLVVAVDVVATGASTVSSGSIVLDGPVPGLDIESFDLSLPYLDVEFRTVYTGEIGEFASASGAATFQSSAEDREIEIQPSLQLYVAERDTGYQWIDAIDGKGTLHVSYRGVIAPEADEPSFSVTANTVDSLLGSSVTGNELRQYVGFALLAANGKPVRVLRSDSDSSTDIAAALARVANTDVFSYLSAAAAGPTDGDTRVAVKSHCATASNKFNMNWRRAYLPLQTPSVWPVVTVTGEELSYTATITAGLTGFSLVTATGIDFTELGLRRGDLYRTSYLNLAAGPTYATYVIASVVSATQLELVAGPSAAISSAVKFEVWKPDSAANVVDYVTSQAEALNSDRVCLIWCDGARRQTAAGLVTVDMSDVAAYVTGLRSYLPLQQGMTDQDLSAVITSCSRMYTKYTTEQLDTIAASGVMIVHQDNENGNPYIRHQLTTRTDNGQLSSEDHVGARHDFVTYSVKDVLKGWKGRYNATKTTLDAVYTAVHTVLTTLASTSSGDLGRIIEAFNDGKGGPNGTFFLEIDGTLKDQFNLSFGCEYSLPLNRIAAESTALTITV